MDSRYEMQDYVLDVFVFHESKITYCTDCGVALCFNCKMGCLDDSYHAKGNIHDKCWEIPVISNIPNKCRKCDKLTKVPSNGGKPASS